MKYSKQNPPLVCMMTNSTNYKDADYGKMVGVLWHSTGANNKTLKRYVQPSPNDPNYNELMKLIGTNTNRNSWNQQTVWAGVNAWIGTLADGTVTSVQALPWNVAPWGVASGWRGSCNWFDGKFYGQFEICEDNLADRYYFDKVYKEGCELTAYLCLIHGIDPKGYIEYKGAKMPTIMCHRDSYDYGMGSSHADVYHWFNRYGKTMDDVRNDVAKLLAGSATIAPNSTTPTTKPSTPAETIYRIRKTWADSKSQKGAFRNLNNAKAECDKYDGYSVFDENGTAVYTSKVTSTATKPSTTSKAVVPNITYAVQTKRHGILPDVKNREDYAGFNNSEIVAIKIGVDVGSVKYRVHTVAGQWLPYVTGCNWDDYNNGYAGDEVHAIDAIEVYYTTDTSKTGGKYYRACYQVKGKGNSNYWANQHDNEKGNGQDGYAGAFGVPIVEIKMSLE